VIAWLDYFHVELQEFFCANPLPVNVRKANSVDNYGRSLIMGGELRGRVLIKI
jgi:hypothetical protein